MLGDMQFLHGWNTCTWSPYLQVAQSGWFSTGFKGQFSRRVYLISESITSKFTCCFSARQPVLKVLSRSQPLQKLSSLSSISCEYFILSSIYLNSPYNRSSIYNERQNLGSHQTYRCRTTFLHLALKGNSEDVFYQCLASLSPALLPDNMKQQYRKQGIRSNACDALVEFQVYISFLSPE